MIFLNNKNFRPKWGVIYTLIGIIAFLYLIPHILDFFSLLWGNLNLLFSSFASTPEAQSVPHIPRVREVTLDRDQVYYLELAKLLVIPVVVVAIVRIYVDRNKKD